MNRMIKKILIIVICLACFAFAIFAAAEIMTFSKALKKSIDDKLYYETNQMANRISMIFENAEGSVDTLCADIKNEFDVQRQHDDSSYIDGFMREHSPVIKDALRDIEDSQGLFLTFAPELTTDRNRAYEIWYSYDEGGDIVSTDATINGIYYEAFQNKALPTMTYYFNAIDNGEKGVWTEPWLDTDIGKELITYSRAVYREDTLIGVLGTDIYTEYTIDFISHMEMENDGMIFLLNEDNIPIIYSDNVDKTGILDSERFWRDTTGRMKSASRGILDATWEDEPMKVSFSMLSNDWKLAVINYENRIYQTYSNILYIVIMLSIILMVFLSAAMFFAIRRFSSPVDKAVQMLKLMELDSQMDEEDTADIKGEDDIVRMVRNVMKRQRLNDIMLANQSRLAAVGEMMAAVTHQWKQPLNNINIVMGNLKDDIDSGYMSEESALLAVEKVERLTTSMSETLKDFSEYLKPDTEMTGFNVAEVIEAALDLLRDKLRSKKIRVSTIGDMTLYAYGYKNALYHAVLNIVNNAIDAIEEKKHDSSSDFQEGEIIISIDHPEDSRNKISIEIFNNGARLSAGQEENMFKPYYSTKGKNNGTGLGLAISRHFIEDRMKGRLLMENHKEGVRCLIIINERE